MDADQVPITEAARLLGLDYQQCRRLVLRGELAGGRDEFGRLFASRAAIHETLRTAEQPADQGRRE